MSFVDWRGGRDAARARRSAELTARLACLWRDGRPVRVCAWSPEAGESAPTTRSPGRPSLREHVGALRLLSDSPCWQPPSDGPDSAA